MTDPGRTSYKRVRLALGVLAAGLLTVGCTTGYGYYGDSYDPYYYGDGYHEDGYYQPGYNGPNYVYSYGETVYYPPARTRTYGHDRPYGYRDHGRSDRHHRGDRRDPHRDQRDHDGRSGRRHTPDYDRGDHHPRGDRPRDTGWNRDQRGRDGDHGNRRGGDWAGRSDKHHRRDKSRDTGRNRDHRQENGQRHDRAKRERQATERAREMLRGGRTTTKPVDRQ